MRVGGEERAGVVEARIPSFGRGPVERDVDIARRHAAYGEAGIVGCGVRWTGNGRHVTRLVEMQMRSVSRVSGAGERCSEGWVRRGVTEQRKDTGANVFARSGV